MKKGKKSRRQFLKNTSLAALALNSSLFTTKVSPQKLSTDKEDLSLCDPTTVDYYGEGPFYTNNPPTIKNNQLAESTEPGNRMIISGRVFNLDCSAYIPNAIIDVWHADHEGAYDNQGFNLRGQTLSNSQGFYMFETIKPGKYLNGSRYRPSHIHYKITAPNYPTLTTQLYFEGDSDILADASASITSGNFDAKHRIIALEANTNGVLEGTWDIVINGEGISTGVNDVHLDKGIIYSASPSPISDAINIRYGVYNKAKVSLLVFDVEGKTVAVLEELTLEPDQYDAVWNPDAALPDGYYFIALKVNDLQIQYLKILRQKKS